jgi:hypothetical protein
VLWGKAGPDHSWMVGVGQDADPVEHNTKSAKKRLKGTIDYDAGSLVPVVMLGRGFLSLAASVRIHCDRSGAELAKWKLAVFDKVMDAWREAHEKWEARKARAEALARADAAASPLHGSTTPDSNRAVERLELRRSVIHMLLGDAQDAGDYSAKAVDRQADKRPALDLDVLADERDGIAFFEQSFEWTNMTWTHYPYYWADSARWADSIRRRADDAQWAAFLSAGATRVTVPVRPGFESSVALYLATGLIWGGGPAPTVGDPSYIAIAEELAESLDTGEVEPDRINLEPVRLPTPLIWLQPTSELNPTSFK